MVFSSFPFLIYFLPAFLLLYVLAPTAWKNGFVLAGSLIFYYYGVKDYPAYMLLILLSVVVNYIAARRAEGCRRIFWRKAWFALGMTWNIGSLFVFKYLDFVCENVNRLLGCVGEGARLPLAHLVLPIGISFYTFQISSYLIDVYRKKIPAERSLLTLGTYLCMFPQLIAGPIVTYTQVREELRERKHSFANVEEGLREFTIGLSLKVLIANRVGGLWSQVGSIGYESISTPMAWLGIIAFTFQIYFDFYGYSLMAKGLGLLMGFHFPDNFRNPYLALSMTDFWRRWHMTLGSWFREYVYIPLGGNRRCQARNIFLVWMLTALWHGADWNYVLWGLYLFMLIGIEKCGFLKVLERKPVLGHLYMCLAIPMSWLLFAIPGISKIGVYLSRLFPFFGQTGAAVYGGDFLKYGRASALPLLAALLCCTGIPRRIYEKKKYTFLAALGLVTLFWLCVYCIYQGLDDPFLYYQF